MKISIVSDLGARAPNSSGLIEPLSYILLTLALVGVTLGFEHRAARLEVQSDADEPPTPTPPHLWWGLAVGKTLASAAFLCFYFDQLISVGASPGQRCADPAWLGAALILSAIGDVALIGKSDRAFLIGLGSFLLAHLAFAVSFLVVISGQSAEANPEGALDITRAIYITSALALLFTGSASAIAYRRFKPEIADELRLPSAVYAGVIAVMVATAFGYAYHLQSLYVALGALAFWLSDLAVAQQRFYGERLPLRGFWVRLWGLPLYYVAQLLFVMELASRS